MNGIDSIERISIIYIIGARGVGKTSLVRALLRKGFKEDITKSKIGITTNVFKINGKKVVIKEITDDEKYTYTNILKNQLEEIIMIIVVFSVDDEDSLEYAKSLILFIENNLTYNLGIQIILFGNKYDSKKISDTKVKVNQIEAENFVSDLENCSYYELSCKTNFNIDVLDNLINDVKESSFYSKSNEKDDLYNGESVYANNNNHHHNNRQSNSCFIFWYFYLNYKIYFNNKIFLIILNKGDIHLF